MHWKSEEDQEKVGGGDEISESTKKPDKVAIEDFFTDFPNFKRKSNGKLRVLNVASSNWIDPAHFLKRSEFNRSFTGTPFSFSFCISASESSPFSF